MRLLLVVLLVLSAFSIKAQSLNTIPGADFTSYANSDEEFWFFDHGDFRWREGGNISFGKYQVNKDSITLTFKTPERQFDVQVNEKKPNLKKTSHLEVRGIDINGKPLVGITVRLLFSSLQAKTDLNGIAKIDIPDSVALKWDVDNIRIENGIAQARMTMKTAGYDYLIAVVWNGDIKYSSSQKVTFHFRKKGDTIFLNDIPYERAR